MMANMPIFQDMAAGLLAGTVKPAAAAEGEGIDFAVLLAGVETGKGGAPGQAVAAAKRPDFVTAMLEQRHGVVGDEMAPALPTGPKTGAPAADGQNLQPSGPEILPDGAGLPATADAGLDRPVRQSAPARFAQMTSALPQVAMAMTADAAAPVVAEPVAKEGEEKESAEKGADQAKAPLMQGLALPLLQGLNLPAPDAQPAAGAAAAKEPQAQPAANPAEGGTKIPGTLLAWAAQPAQIHAQAGKQASDPVAHSSGVGHAATRPTNNRQALALELAALSLGKSPSSEIAPASASKAEVANDVAAVVAVPAPAAGGAPAPVNPDMSGAMEIAAPLPAVIAAVDTGAMLGEQVIDMGVDGQWIDRMAREIADISAGTGRASFTLNPENRGRLQVEILQRDEGADVRLIAETDEAVTALSQGRQQLQQDARLQAVRIHDVQVERAPVDRSQPEAGISARGNASAQDMAGQQGQSQSFHKKPLIEAVSSMVTGQEQDLAASEQTRSQHARYA